MKLIIYTCVLFISVLLVSCSPKDATGVVFEAENGLSTIRITGKQHPFDPWKAKVEVVVSEKIAFSADLEVYASDLNDETVNIDCDGNVCTVRFSQTDGSVLPLRLPELPH